MSTNVEFDEKQKKIVADFITKVKEKQFLTEEDFEVVFEFFKQIVTLEGGKFGFSSEFEKLDNKLIHMSQEVANDVPKNEWNGLDIAACDASNSLEKDSTLYLDPVFFCKRYFGRSDMNDRLEGVVNLLFSIYHETHHAVKLMDISKNNLSPESLEMAREILLRSLYQDDFYKENYKSFSFENMADEYAINMVNEIIEDKELDEEKSKFVEAKRKEINSAKLKKISYRGKLHGKDDVLPLLCDNEIEDFPKLLYVAPVLQKEYNPNGTKKGLIELFDGLFEDVRRIVNRDLGALAEFSPETKDDCLNCQTFYYEIIGPELDNATDREYKILAEKYGALTLQSVLENMEKYFNHKAQGKLQHTTLDNDSSYENEEEIKNAVKHRVNSIVRFRNGVELNPIAEKLLREGGFVRGTREFLDVDTAKRRKMLAMSLMQTYDGIESEEEYCTRAENEKNDIDGVINTLYYNRLSDLTNVVTVEENGEDIKISGTARFVHMLKMSNIISNTLGRNYFEELLKVPDVNRALSILEKDKNGYLNHCMKKVKVSRNSSPYPKTEAEEGKYSSYILGEENSEISSKVLMLNDEIGVPNVKRNFGMMR